MLQSMLYPGIPEGRSYFLSKLFWEELRRKSLYNHATTSRHNRVKRTLCFVSPQNNACCKTVLQKTLHVCLSDKMEFRLQKILDENSNKTMEATFGFLQERDLSPSRP